MNMSVNNRWKLPNLKGYYFTSENTIGNFIKKSSKLTLKKEIALHYSPLADFTKDGKIDMVPPSQPALKYFKLNNLLNALKNANSKENAELAKIVRS